MIAQWVECLPRKHEDMSSHYPENLCKKLGLEEPVCKLGGGPGGSWGLEISQYNLARERPCFHKVKSNRGRYPALISSLHTNIQSTGQKCIRIRTIVYMDLCIFFLKLKKPQQLVLCVCICHSVCGGQRTTYFVCVYMPQCVWKSEDNLPGVLVLSSIMWVLAIELRPSVLVASTFTH